MASSTPATIFTLMIGARYSSLQSCSVAGTSCALGTDCRIASDSGQPRISTPLAAYTAPIFGKNSAATPRATSKPSLALQGLYLLVLALSATFTAMAMSQGSST
ncbi:hypothetical protein D3C86_1796510 [compost metagenome]